MAPRSNVRVSSGVPKLFCSALPVMAVLLPGAVRGFVRSASPVPVAASLQRWIVACAARGGWITCMKSLAVRVLGDFGVDGVEPQALGSRKATARAAAARARRRAGGALGRAHRRAVGGPPPARPDDQLAVLMSRLRSVLGRDRIEHHDGGYLLRCDWLDAAELAKLTDEADRRRGAGNTVGAAAAARVALSLAAGAGPAPAPGEWARAAARRAGAAGQPGPPGGGRRPARGGRLGRRLGGRGAGPGPRPLRRGGAAAAASRLRVRRPGRGGAGHLRQGQGAPGRRAGHRSLAGDGRPVHRDPAR